MRFDETLDLAVGNNKLKDLIAAVDSNLPMWATEVKYEAPGPTYDDPNTVDISVGPNDMAALDDGSRFSPGDSDREAPGIGKINLTLISIRAEAVGQRIRVTITP